MSPDLLAKFKRFGPTELDQVPASPGVYAWYAKPQIGAADWARLTGANGEDIGETSFRALLAKHTSRFAPHSLRVNAHHSFRDTWDGRLRPLVFDKHVAAITKKDLSDTDAQSLEYPTNSMDKVFASEKQRGRMSTLLTELASPLFCAPLYIGKSKNLHRRINDHFSETDKWHRLIQRDAQHRDTLRAVLFEGDRTRKIPDIFATRAIASGFIPDNLEVYVLDVCEALDISPNLALELAEALEWLLNTWHRPILGRA
ncbi:GIY-YIG nuclease family protein [Burkholderia sola]